MNPIVCRECGRAVYEDEPRTSTPFGAHCEDCIPIVAERVEPAFIERVKTTVDKRGRGADTPGRTTRTLGGSSVITR